MRVLVIAVILAALITPTLAVSSTGEPLARKAYALAKRANVKASKALALTGRVTVAGPQGMPGERGTDGQNGVNGRDGVDGAKGAPGADGQKGDVGPQGAQGAQGPEGQPGVANVNATSATNPGTVIVDTSFTTVVSLSYEGAGQAFISAEAQINGENATADGLYCELRADSATLSERFISVAGNGQESLAASGLTSGGQTAALVCRRNSSLSDVEVPAERARLTVLAG